jgi:hypothetical protein
MVYNHIINNLNEIIGDNKTSENVYNTFKIANEAIQNNEIGLEINPIIDPELNNKMANTILGGMYFRKNKSGNVNLVFGQKYLDTYTKNSSFHYTILMHEFKHLYDYIFNKASFFNSNEKEIFQYELNAVNIEAEFIKYYLSGKFNLSKFENYIFESYENDNLDSWTIANRKVSADIYRTLIDIEKKYKLNIISKEQLIKILLQMVDQLLIKADNLLNLFDVYNSNKNNFSPYGHFIRLKTFEKYLKYIFKNESDFNEMIMNNIEFKEKYKIIIFQITEHDQANSLYSSSLDNYWEDDIINRL